MKQIAFCSFLILFSACSFDQYFLAPEYSSPEKRKEIRKIGEEYRLTVEVGEDMQPYFLNDAKDTLELSYTVESVFVESTSGNKIHAWMMRPKENFNGISMLFCHGNSGSIASNFYGAISFLENGFEVCIFDYSGFGFSEGEASRKNVKLDGFAAMEYLQKAKNPNSKKVIIYGQSLGGNLAPTIAVKYQEQIDGLAIEGAFSAHKDMSAKFTGLMGRIMVAEKYSAKRAIRKFYKPVLVIHSTEDATVPFEMGQKIYNNANEPKEFYQIEECHICGPYYYPNEIIAKMKALVGM